MSYMHRFVITAEPGTHDDGHRRGLRAVRSHSRGGIDGNFAVALPNHEVRRWLDEGEHKISVNYSVNYSVRKFY